MLWSSKFRRLQHLFLEYIHIQKVFSTYYQYNKWNIIFKGLLQFNSAINIQVNKNLFYLSFYPLSHEIAVIWNASVGHQSAQWNHSLLGHPEKTNCNCTNQWKLVVASTCLLDNLLAIVNSENVPTCQIFMSSLKLDTAVCGCAYRAKARMENFKSLKMSIV